MLKGYISEEKILALGGDILSSINFPIIQRGFDYYQKGKVDKLKFNEYVVEAIVQGTWNYYVGLDLKDFSASYCDCPVQGRCKHMVAAFFRLYGLIDGPENLFKIIKTKVRYSKSDIISFDLSRISKHNKLFENSDLNDWYRYYESQLNLFRNGTYFIGQFEIYERFLESLFQVVEEWSTPTKEYFKFHGCVFTMQKIENNYSGSNSHYYYNSTLYFRKKTSQFINFLIDTIADVANSNDNLTTKFNQDAINKLRELMLRNTESYFDWLHIYRLLWTQVFHNPLLIEVEIETLVNKLSTYSSEAINRNSNNYPPINQYNGQIALAHFHFIKGEEDIALEYLIAHRVKLQDIISYFRFFYHQQLWASLARWLKATQDLLGTADEEEFHTVTQFWVAVATNRGDYTECLEMLRSALPKSDHQYSEVLLKAGLWKKWVDFHLANESTPYTINKSGLMQVEQADGTLLLPLYHHFVYRLLLKKNRSAYQEAVQFLIKLRTLYKRLKRLEEWEGFIEGLVTRTRRLRALQEELRKGKLLI